MVLDPSGLAAEDRLGNLKSEMGESRSLALCLTGVLKDLEKRLGFLAEVAARNELSDSEGRCLRPLNDEEELEVEARGV